MPDDWTTGYIFAMQEIFGWLQKYPNGDTREMREWLADEMGLSVEARRDLGLSDGRDL